MADDTDSHAGIRAAQAFDRTLEAERAGQAAIADHERQMAEYLEHARQRRRTILDRAQTRIVTLHARAAQALELKSAAILEQRKSTATDAVERLSDPTRRAQALERLATRLTSDRAEPGGDGP